MLFGYRIVGCICRHAARSSRSFVLLGCRYFTAQTNVHILTGLTLQHSRSTFRRRLGRPSLAPRINRHTFLCNQLQGNHPPGTLSTWCVRNFARPPASEAALDGWYLAAMFRSTGRAAPSVGEIHSWAPVRPHFSLYYFGSEGPITCCIVPSCTHTSNGSVGAKSFFLRLCADESRRRRREFRDEEDSLPQRGDQCRHELPTETMVRQRR